MMARACVFRDIEVWMRMDPGRGAGDVAQIRSKLHRSRERDGQGIRVYTSAHTPTQKSPPGRRQQPSTHALDHSE
jgi:hypothetical protein